MQRNMKKLKSLPTKKKFVICITNVDDDDEVSSVTERERDPV